MIASFRKGCQQVLQRGGLYERLKGSPLYSLYWRWVDPRKLEERDRELRLFRRIFDGISPNALAFDIGANQGQRTYIFLKLGMRVVAVDPDVSNVRRLAERFHFRRIKKKPVEIVGQAVSDRVGEEIFWISSPGFEMNTLSSKWAKSLTSDPTRFGRKMDFSQTRKVQTTTLEQLIARYGRPFYVKIDVEGYELNVLNGLQTVVPYVSFEVNLPEFRAEGLQCIQRLNEIEPGGSFNYAAGGDTLESVEWISSAQFTKVLENLPNTSVEVFWKAGVR